MSVDKDSLKAGAELLEVVVDTFITPNGLVKDIPVVGSIFSLAEACNTFRNKRFAKRISAFLTNFSPEDFEKFKKAVAKKSNEDLGEEILSVINIGLLEQELQPALAGATVIPLPSFISSEQGRLFYKSIVCGK